MNDGEGGKEEGTAGNGWGVEGNQEGLESTGRGKKGELMEDDDLYNKAMLRKLWVVTFAALCDLPQLQSLVPSSLIRTMWFYNPFFI